MKICLNRASTSAFSTPSTLLSQADCHDLIDRILALTRGGGRTNIALTQRIAGSTLWARNRAYVTAETTTTDIRISRNIDGALAHSATNRLDDEGLQRAVFRAEQALRIGERAFEAHTETFYDDPILAPKLWSNATTSLESAARTALAEELIAPADAAGLLSAGALSTNLEATTTHTANGTVRYYTSTGVECSMTVRDGHGTASGWAGVNHYDLAKIDPHALARRALQKCQQAAHPAAIEPGRYTVILEPQAVADLVIPLFASPINMDRRGAETDIGPWSNGPDQSKINERVTDPRLTVRSDPMDPEAGFVPYDRNTGAAYHPVHWIEHGVLRALAYGRWYAVHRLGNTQALPCPGSFTITPASGVSTMTVEEMIAHTQRGIVVTRLHDVRVVDDTSLLCTGYTRDGVWLVENGVITKAVKNFRFNESPLFVLNNVDAIGIPTRVFAPGLSVVVPALLAHDFSFVGLTDAI